jgi:hypothetical protein
MQYVEGMSNMPKDFDAIAVVVDWLDACRKRDLGALLDLYADDAGLYPGNMREHPVIRLVLPPLKRRRKKCPYFCFGLFRRSS